MFNPAHTTHTLLPSSDTHFNTHVFIYVSFIKRAKDRSAVIHSWMHNTTHSHSVSQALFYQTAYHPYTNNSPHLVQNKFWPLFRIWIANSLSLKISFQVTPILSRQPIFGRLHLVCISIRFYSIQYTPHQLPVGRDIIQLDIFTMFFIEPIMIKLKLFQLTSSWTWHHLVTVHPLKLHPNIISPPNSLERYFCFHLYITHNLLGKHFFVFNSL